MSSKPIPETDYRNGIGDKYGRATCSHCGKYRRINAYWQDTNRILCKGCSVTPHVAFANSIRGGGISVSVQL